MRGADRGWGSGRGLPCAVVLLVVVGATLTSALDESTSCTQGSLYCTCPNSSEDTAVLHSVSSLSHCHSQGMAAASRTYIQDAMTLEAWVRPTGSAQEVVSGGRRAVLSLASDTLGLPSWGFWLGELWGQYVFGLATEAGNGTMVHVGLGVEYPRLNESQEVANSILDDIPNKWRHLLGAYDGHCAWLCLDGIEAGRVCGGDVGGNLLFDAQSGGGEAGAVFSYGGYYDGNEAREWRGWSDEARLWTRAKKCVEARDFMTRGTPSQCWSEEERVDLLAQYSSRIAPDGTLLYEEGAFASGNTSSALHMRCREALTAVSSLSLRARYRESESSALPGKEQGFYATYPSGAASLSVALVSIAGLCLFFLILYVQKRKRSHELEGHEHEHGGGGRAPFPSSALSRWLRRKLRRDSKRGGMAMELSGLMSDTDDEEIEFGYG